ncbi:hypothetical protein ABGB17_32880 [Sphaerisporangium sp. B11E5]|uniref:hypothetical protein n=1 Tax=Sphaerisporangium sp. B11E5 TaxID=3153563 RepID=UPI00325E615F
MTTSAGDRRVAHVIEAAHAGEAHRRLIAYCRRAVETGAGLHCVSHFGSGVFDFSVDVLEAGDCEDVLGMPCAQAREQYVRVARQLVARHADFDESLTALRSGSLMRMIVEAGGVALHCGRLRAGEHLVGATLHAEQVEAMDRAMSGLVTEIRVRELRLSDEHPGGDHGMAQSRPRLTSGPHFETGPALGTPSQARLFDLWAGAVNAEDLHYLALYKGWSPACAGDAFGDPALGLWFTDITLGTRRALYRDIARRLRADLARLRHALRHIVDAPVERLVLDVEAGALYVHWLGTAPGDFLLGVTFFQDKVHYAENRMREVAEEVRAAG